MNEDMLSGADAHEQAPAKRGRPPKSQDLSGREAAQIGHNSQAGQRPPAREDAREVERQQIPAGREVALDRDGQPLWRRRDNTLDKFAIPEELRDPDWDIQWNCAHILNMPNTSQVLADRENGWRPIPADRPGFKGRFMPPDHKGSIIRDGLELCERPKSLTNEARREDFRNAMAQRQQNRQEFGLPGNLPRGYDPAPQNISKFDGRPAGVRVDIEGGPQSEGRYKLNIDE